SGGAFPWQISVEQNRASTVQPFSLFRKILKLALTGCYGGIKRAAIGRFIFYAASYINCLIERQASSFPSPVSAEKGITTSSGSICNVSCVCFKCLALFPLTTLSSFVAITITGSL